MELPYSLEVFAAVMATYNADYGIAAWLACGVLIILAVVAHRCPRLAGIGLGAAWIVVGLAQQLGVMAAFNFMAPVYGYGWIVWGAAIAALGYSGKIGFAPVSPFFAALLVVGVLGYPAALWLWEPAFGDVGALPLAATAANPTAMLTAAVLCRAVGSRWSLAVAWIGPIAWAGVAAMTAQLMPAPVDWLVVAVIGSAVLGAVVRRKTANHS